MNLMRAIDIRGGKGSPSALYLSADVPRPSPEVGEVLIKVKCFGLNRMDLSQRAGIYPVPPQASKILGVEFSGIVEELGAGENESFSIGDAVFGLAYGGAYAEYIAVSARMLIHKPEEIPWDVAAGISETWATAIQAMYLVANFAPGKSILWHAGASSVSLAGIQLCKAHGASAIYATAGSPEKIKLSESVGATKTWNYRTEDWATELDRLTEGKGVDIIIDFIGPAFFQDNINSMALDGQMVIVGLLSGSKLPTDIDIYPFVKRRIRVEGSRLRSRSTEYQGRLRDMLVKEALPGLTSGQFVVPIDKVFDWNQIQEAHKLMENNGNKGKIVCRVV